MNGVTSALMREKGVKYKLNFGVAIPRLRQIAAAYSSDEALAGALWEENVRELKILATLLYPPEKFNQASFWVKDIENLELAEQAAMNLFCKLPDALHFASEWIESGDYYVKISGFLLYGRLLMQDVDIQPVLTERLVYCSLEAFQKDSSLLHQVVRNTLQRLFLRYPEQKVLFMDNISVLNSGNNGLQQRLTEFFEIE